MAEVLPAPSMYDGQSYIPDSLLRHSPPSHSPIYIGTPRSCSPQQYSSSSSVSGTSDQFDSQSSSSPPSPQIGPYLSRSPSYHSTPPSTISLEAKEELYDLDKSWLPTYTTPSARQIAEPPTPRPTPVGVPQSPAPTPERLSTPIEDSESQSRLPPVADDSSLKDEPSRQVDYLSHDWREEDIWASWKHITSKRKELGESSRLENASWRQWAKQKNRLSTVSPETLNWYVYNQGRRCLSVEYTYKLVKAQRL